MTREKALEFIAQSVKSDVDMALVADAIKALEQEPKTEIALNRYKDLQDYFGDEAIAKIILNNQTEFKAWLERLKWNTKKADELARKLEALEQKSILDKISSEIEKLRPNLRPEQMTDYDYAMVLAVETLETIIDEYKAESEG